jgi:hypothetical protein
MQLVVVLAHGCNSCHWIVIGQMYWANVAGVRLAGHQREPMSVRDTHVLKL